MKCEICKNQFVVQWTDLHGEATCVTCGTPYQILHYEDGKRVEKDPTMNIKSEFVSYLQKYWDENKTNMGLGTFLLRNPNQENCNLFYEWLDNEMNKE